MKFMSLLIAFVAFLAQASLCQHTLILIKRNGETIACNKVKFEDDHVILTLENKEKLTVHHNDIVAYFDSELQELRYLKPVVRYQQNFIGEIVGKDTTRLDFVELLECGEINLYRQIITTGTAGHATAGAAVGMGTVNNDYYYYAEKDRDYAAVFVTGFLHKDEGLLKFKSFVEDDAEILAMIETEDFRYNQNNLLDVVREYNVRNFKAGSADKYQPKANIGLYARVRPKLKEKLILKVNDSIEYKLPASQLPLPIKLPINVPSKVCVTLENNSSCAIVAPISFAVQYYELNYAPSKTSFEIQKRSIKEVKRYLDSIQKN